MDDETRIRSLLEEIMEMGVPIEEACRDDPGLLTQVRLRLQRVRNVEAELEAIFPRSAAGSEADPPGNGRLPRIPGHAVEALLARGGMGLVYRATHLRLRRVVAVKMLLMGTYASAHELKCLQREAEAVAALKHPNIVQVYEVGDVDGLPYFTMEYVEGGTLAERLAGNPQPARSVASLVATLADAVHAAHQSGVVHRDLKPGNILLTADGVPKVADFSLARRFAADATVTLMGARVGTPSYMAPEQAAGTPRAFDPAVDVYALGAILYEMLTGRPPFKADTPSETQRQVIMEEPVAPSRLNMRIPRDIETICLTCLSKDPSHRYSSAGALSSDLHRYLRGETIAARPAGAAERLRKWVRRHPARTAAGFVVILSTAMVFSALLWTISQRSALEREVEADFAEVVRLQQASDWSAARNMLERAKTRINLGFGSGQLERRAAEIGRELDLVDRLAAMRFERAASQEIKFDREKWWRSYKNEFIAAGLLKDGDASEAFADRVAGSDVKRALIDAMDDWAICATDKGELQWLLIATRTADPDPAWRDRARSVATWQDQASLAALAREAQPGDQPVPLMLIVAGLLTEMESDEGLRFLRRIQAAHPSDFWACFALAETLDRKDPDAVAFYRAAVSLRPQASAAHVNLGIVLAEQGRTPEAIESMRRAVALDPHNHLAQYNLAVWLLQQQQYDGAAAHAQMATDLNQSDPMAYGVLGSALLRLERPSEAAESFRRAISLLPEGHPKRESFGRALAKCEELLAPLHPTGNP